VIIVGVGAVAIMMLTGHGPTNLAERGNQKPAATPAARPSMSMGANAEASPSMTMPTFPEYAGKTSRTAEEVTGIASDGTTEVAVGTADGYPAAWQRSQAGSWSLVTAPETGNQALTSVHEGNGGWVAVGESTSGAPHPVVLTSADGHTWQAVDDEHAFSTPGEYMYGEAAGPAGYLVVGKIQYKGRTYAADWWSTNLTDWTRAGNGGLDGRLASSEMLAAVGTPGGFVAVGQHADHPAAWMSGTAHDWMEMDLPVPDGASSAMLTQVTGSGNHLVALGEATTAHGTVPFAATSADGGASWNESALTSPSGGSTTVTAITATSSGFVAAGQSGQTAVYWMIR
jgi:hypothetical protein